MEKNSSVIKNEDRNLLCQQSRTWNYKVLSAKWTLGVQNIRNILILSCTTLCPQSSLNSLGHGLYKVSNAFHRDAGPCWLQCFPQLCQVGWISFGCCTILDTHRKLLSVKNPAALQFLTETGVPGTYYHTPFKGAHIFCLGCSLSEWHTYTIHVSIVSRLKNPSLTYLLPFIYIDWPGEYRWKLWSLIDVIF